MKKQVKKLKLAKETVKALESGIEHARGGTNETGPSRCPQPHPHFCGLSWDGMC